MATKNKLHPDYSSNVFINCPFDGDYDEILRAIQFTIIDCGFIPRCALEAHDSDDVRIEKILSIINDCKYGIHDISRTDLDAINRLPRFNMPLELGMFIGCKKYGSHEKKYLILDTEKHRYQKFVSDIAGQDIKAHAGEPEKAVKAVRNWLHGKSNRTTLASGSVIHDRYIKFQNALPDICKDMEWNIDELTFMDYFECVKLWLKLITP